MAGVSTDTVGLRVKPGSFVVKRGSSILNEKLLDKILGKKPKGYAGGGTVPINATPEERIATPEEVAMYGIDFFRAINNSSDNATHPERMDALIAQSELAGMKPMYDGGEVAPGYENGGNVPKSILNIPFSLLANILNKPVPRTSTVLSPEEQILMELESGAHFPKTDVPSPEEEILSELINVAKQKEKDRPIASPFKGYENGGSIPPNVAKYISQMQVMPDMDIRRSEPLSDLNLGLERLMEEQEAIPDVYEQIKSYPGKRIFQEKKGYPDAYETISALKGDKAGLEYLLKQILGQNPKKQYADRPWSRGGGERTGYQIMSRGKASEIDKETGRQLENYIYDPETGEIKKSRNVLTERMISIDPEDVVGYQQGEQVVDPNDPLGINERQAMGAQAYAGSTIAGAGGGVSVGDVAEAVEIDEMQKANQVMEALKLQGIYNEPERSGYFEFQGDVPQSKADQMKMAFSLLRDMENQKALNQLLMQTGRMGGQLNPREQGLFFKP